MKQLIFTITLTIIFCTTSFSQIITDFEYKDAKVYLTDVRHVDASISSSVLMKRAKLFIQKERFDRAFTVQYKVGGTADLQMTNKEDLFISEEMGEISGVAFYAFWSDGIVDRFGLMFDYSIFVKDGRYKYVINNINIVEFVVQDKTKTHTNGITLKSISKSNDIRYYNMDRNYKAPYKKGYHYKIFTSLNNFTYNLESFMRANYNNDDW
jgi:hypothetical protein